MPHPVRDWVWCLMSCTPPFLAIVSGEVLPRRRFGVETRRAPSLPLVAPPLGFPRYRAPEGALKEMIGSSDVGFYGEASPTPLLSLLQGANRRAAVAVSGVAAERPMEPKGVASPFASLRFLPFLFPVVLHACTVGTA